MTLRLGAISDSLANWRLKIWSFVVAVVYGVGGLFACWCTAPISCSCGPFDMCSMCMTPIEKYCGVLSIICVVLCVGERITRGDKPSRRTLRFIAVYYVLYFAVDGIHAAQDFSCIKALFNCSTIVGFTTIFLGWSEETYAKKC